jgi:hypothetical protein
LRACILEPGAGLLRARIAALPLSLPDGGPLPVLHPPGPDRRRAARGLGGRAALLAPPAGSCCDRRHRLRRARGAGARAGQDLALGGDAACGCGGALSEGTVASLVAAKRSVFAGDADAALSSLERAVARGYNRFDQLEADAAWEAIREDERFRRLVRALAAGWIERSTRKRRPTQTELRVVAHAHVAREEYSDALRVYEAAVAAGGPDSEAIRAEIEAVRSVLASGNPNLRLRLGATSPRQD